MITIDDGALFQWDTNRRLILTGEDAEAIEVHFARYHSKCEALVVLVKEVDSIKYVDVPNSMLVKSCDICAWTWDGEDTISGVRMHVHRKNKPCDYVYTPTEVLTFKKFADEISSKIDDFIDAHATSYSYLSDKPKINDVELEGNKSFGDLGMVDITDQEIIALFKE